MKNVKSFLLILTVLITASCQTIEAGRYFKRPNIKACISNGDGTCYIKGELVEDTTNFLCSDPENYATIQEYYEDKEYRLMLCLRYGRCK